MEIVEIITMVYLFLFSIYHVITGIVSIFFPEFSLKFYKVLYGFNPRETKQLVMTFKPWGNLALAVGFIGFMILFNLDQFYFLLLPLTLLLVIRVWYRSAYGEEIKKEWGISSGQNWRMIFIQILGIIIYLSYIVLKI
ncbi:MAG: hypothetical protein Q7S27_06470 [Nanoarchaeota archaeon]|nr:hypothetical protein [Nanoarchaeota archaeon]